MTASDAEQCIVRFVIVRCRKVGLVGRNQGQALAVSEIDKSAFNPALALVAMSLQFDIESIAEQARQAIATEGGKRGVVSLDSKRDRPVGSTGQRDQVFRLALQPIELDVRG